MAFSSLHHQHQEASPQNRASASPLAFLDDPLHSATSTFLFLSTIILASLLIFHLMRHHYHRAKKYTSACPACRQTQPKLGDVTRQNLQATSTERTGLDSARGEWYWKNEVSPSSAQSHTGNLFDLGDGTQYYSGPTITPSSTFYTPLSHSTRTPSNVYQGVYCDIHSASGNVTAVQHSGFTHTDLDGVNRERSNRDSMSGWWPAALQQVVVGDVGESLIAKRRRSTLKRGD